MYPISCPLLFSNSMLHRRRNVNTPLSHDRYESDVRFHARFIHAPAFRSCRHVVIPSCDANGVKHEHRHTIHQFTNTHTPAQLWQKHPSPISIFLLVYAHDLWNEMIWADIFELDLLCVSPQSAKSSLSSASFFIFCSVFFFRHHNGIAWCGQLWFEKCSSNIFQLIPLRFMATRVLNLLTNQFKISARTREEHKRPMAVFLSLWKQKIKNENWVETIRFSSPNRFVFRIRFNCHTKWKCTHSLTKTNHFRE